MKKILSLIYLSLSLILVGCTSDTVADMEPNHVGTRDFEWSKRIYGVMPQLETGDDQLQSRSTLVFDNASKTLKFAWTSGDVIGVFPVNEQKPANQQQQKFKAVGGSASTVFESVDEQIKSLAGNTRYIAYYPVKDVDVDYTKVPISYENQKQEANVNIKAFFANANSEEYVSSENEACAHLPRLDYMAAAPVITGPNGGANFSFTRMGSVVRFYLKVPDAVIFDSLQVVNNEADFVLTADMNVATAAISPKRTGHMVSLHFGDSGFDLTEKSSNNYNQSSNEGYIIAYVMFAPINLSNKINSTLYLLGHKIVDGNTVKLYYRAKDGLSKINIARNKVQQWKLNGSAEVEPITFEPISVQEWTEGTTLNNGENGEGTQGW